MDFDLIHFILLPIGLGLFGFIEPCSIGATLIFLKAIEGRSNSAKLTQVLVFALTRAIFIGLLGVLAVAIGAAFLGIQKLAWIVLGALFIAIGALYLLGRANALMSSLGPSLSMLASHRGSALLGLLFGLNIPACAAPLLFALLGIAAAGGVGAEAYIGGFISLGLFGFALSLPLIITVAFPSMNRLLDRLAGLSSRMPALTGLVMIALGAWSIWFGLFVTVKP